MKTVILLLTLVSLSFGNFLQELHTDNVEGKFKQTKYIKNFENNITTSGKFSIHNGVFEQNTTKPIMLAIKVDKSGVYEYNDGKYKLISSYFDKELFLDILDVNLQNLKDKFDYIINGDISSWNVELKPKGVLSKIFHSINISGDSRVRQLILNEINGDVTRYDFE